MIEIFLLLTFMLRCISSLVIIQAEEEIANTVDNFDHYLLEPPFMGCSEESYPPSFWQHIPEYVIDLDKPPEERWLQLVTDKKPDLLHMFDVIKNYTSQIFGDKAFKLIDNYLPWFTKTLPKDYYNELIGVSTGCGLPVGEVTIFNLCYEFYSACTSIVMQSTNNQMYLGRNLDFGFLLGWDTQNKTWLAPEYLRPLVVKLEFKRKNQTVYKAISFAGYIGILTAVKKDAFALSINERFKLEGGYVGVVEWILGRRSQKWLGILTREVMEKAESYSQAEKLLYTPTLIAPVYFTLAGRKSHQGCVITRGRTNKEIWSLDPNSTEDKGRWFLIQTNYDHWKKPPFYDNRVDPANVCMKKFGSSRPKDTLYKVLSTRPVLNKETVFTAIMDVTSGDIEVWNRNCEDPCWPW